MSQLGIADTLKLLAAGYKKKDIDAMAALDDKKEPEPKKEDPAPDPEPKKEDPAPDPEPKKEDPEPDYKKMLEEAQAKQRELEDKINKLQQDNIHKDSGKEAAEAKKAEHDSLINMVKGYM